MARTPDDDGKRRRNPQPYQDPRDFFFFNRSPRGGAVYPGQPPGPGFPHTNYILDQIAARGSLSLQPQVSADAPRPRTPPRPTIPPGTIILGSPAPALPTQPAPRPAPRRRPPKRKRPPARPRRPPARRTLPGQWPEVEPPAPKKPPAPVKLPRIVPRIFRHPALDFVFESWRLYIEGPLRRRTAGPLRRTAPRPAPAVFNPLPTPNFPAPGPLPVDVPTVVSSPPFRRVQEDLGYDPFILAPPVGRPVFSPSPAPRAAPRRGLPLSLSPPSYRARPARPRIADRAPPEIGRLTQLKPAPLQSIGRVTVADPTADPCAVRARDARRKQRQRRKECKRFVTKTVRVCADKR